MVLTLQKRIFIVENDFRDGGKYTKKGKSHLKKHLVQKAGLCLQVNGALSTVVVDHILLHE